MKLKFLISFVLIITFSYQCSKENPATYDCSGITPTYTLDVKPILDANCAISGCHNASSKKDGKDYSTYSATKSRATDKAFMGSMQHLSGYANMPEKAAKLSDDKLKTISCWIENGMPE